MTNDTPRPARVVPVDFAGMEKIHQGEYTVLERILIADLEATRQELAKAVAIIRDWCEIEGGLSVQDHIGGLSESTTLKLSRLFFKASALLRELEADNG